MLQGSPGFAPRPGAATLAVTIVALCEGLLLEVLVDSDADPASLATVLTRFSKELDARTGSRRGGRGARPG